MNTSALGKLLLICSMALAALAARADDIDIYGGVASTAAPNVLIIVDNTSSNDAAYTSSCPFSAKAPNLPNSTLLDMVYCSLYGALNAIATPNPDGSPNPLLGKLNVGLMVGGSGSNKGGQMFYPNSSPYNLPLMDSSGIASFQSLVAGGIPKATGNAKLDGDMQEAWAWLTGNTGPRSGTAYTKHIGVLSCQKTFIILIGAAAKQGRPDTGSGFTRAADLAAAGATVAQQQQINTYNVTQGSYTGDDNAWIDEWARFLYQANFGTAADPQSARTYTIAAGAGSAGTDPDYTQVLHSTAINGGGQAFVATDYNSMVQAILQVFNQVQAVNSVFASASLPVSTNAQGTYLNQVFMGTFRPDAAGAPRWMGNLKQYQLGVDNTNPNSPALFLADASWGPYQPNTTANPALSSAGTGFLAPTAISFWTGKDTTKAPDAAPSSASVGGFWLSNPQGAGGTYDSPDGEVVEKGGVGQQIRLANLTDDYAANPSGPRNVYTCLVTGGGTCAQNTLLSTMPFATSNANITAALLGSNGAPMAISSIARGTTTATVTLASAPSPALAAGQTITIVGSKYPEFNGTFSVTPLSATTFSYPITVDPPSPATGNYSASLPSNPLKITSLTRSSTSVTATTASAHGYTTGATVTIAGAAGANYNGSFVVTTTGANTFTYTISDGPPSPDGGGTATIGSTSTAIPAGGIVRSPSDATNKSNVTVNMGTNITVATGNTVTISGAGPGGVSPYNGSWTVANTGNNCTGGKNKQSFCFSINSTPASPDTGTGITADSGTLPLAITSLSYTVGTCAASAYSTVTVTANTATAPSFHAGDTVSVGGTVAANESAYVGSFKVLSVSTSSPYKFTYSIQTSPGNSTTCTDTTAGMTASVGGVARNALINWVRGSDNVGDEASPGNGITIRPSVHGDVLHSRPAVINYGGTTGVVVFYGANDGIFRAVNGNQPASTNQPPAPLGNCSVSADCSIGGVPPGGELWGFVPSEFYSKLSRLYANSPIVKMPTTPSGIMPTPQPKSYFFDGTPSIYQNGGTAYLYLSARRGGQVIYAIDVSSPTAPKFMWKHTNQDTGFAELGQTWSQPKVAVLSCTQNPAFTVATSSCNPSASPPVDPGYPVLVFGAGYDPNEDNEPPTADSMGRGIFIVDAATGSLLWSARSGGGTDSCTGTPCQLKSMTYAMPADVTLIDRDYDGHIDRLYAADLGGNIWRVDLKPSGGSPNYGPSSWQTTLFASLGGSGSTKRKFFFPPDVVLTKQFDAVLAISGDREHPLASEQANNIVNRFYMIKDTNVGMSAAGWTPVTDNTSSTADLPPASLFNASSTAYANTLSGFYISLLGLNPSATPTMGEKGVNAPITVGGLVHFGTNQPTAPSSNSCQANLGTARTYEVNFLTGVSTNSILDGGGLAPSPVYGLVTVNVNGQQKQLPFLIGAGGGNAGADSRSGIGAQRPDIPIVATKKRIYWYRSIDR